MKFTHIATAVCLFGCATIPMACQFSVTKDKAQSTRSASGKEFYRDSKKWGPVVTRIPELAPFTHIVLNADADIDLYQGDDYVVNIEGNEKAIENYDIHVEQTTQPDDGMLYIGLRDHAPSRMPEIKISLTVPDLRSIKANSDGDIDIKSNLILNGDLLIEINNEGDVDGDRNTIECNHLVLTMKGNGDMKTRKWVCEKADILAGGNGDMKGDLRADSITLQAEDEREVELDVKCNHLNVTAGGNSEVTLKGKCSTLTKLVTGKASLNSRRLSVNKNIHITNPHD